MSTGNYKHMTKALDGWGPSGMPNGEFLQKHVGDSEWSVIDRMLLLRVAEAVENLTVLLDPVERQKRLEEKCRRERLAVSSRVENIVWRRIRNWRRGTGFPSAARYDFWDAVAAPAIEVVMRDADPIASAKTVPLQVLRKRFSLNWDTKLGKAVSAWLEKYENATIPEA